MSLRDYASKPATDPQDVTVTTKIKELLTERQVTDYDKQFLNSLLSGFERYGSLSEKQRAAALNTLESYKLSAGDADLCQKLSDLSEDDTKPSKVCELARSLAMSFEEWKKFTPKQRELAERLVSEN
jgi:hypothetical protein